VFLRQRTTLRSLIDDCDVMSADQRKRILGTIFEEIIAGARRHLGASAARRLEALPIATITTRAGTF
jgi:hypothetical protein